MRTALATMTLAALGAVAVATSQALLRRPRRSCCFARFDALMLMTNGNLPLTEAQRKSLLDCVGSGKGLIGAQCAALTFYDYPAFGEMLGGYYRRWLRQNAIGVLKVEDPPSCDAHAWRQLAASRRVLSLRHRALGRQPAQGPPNLRDQRTGIAAQGANLSGAIAAGLQCNFLRARGYLSKSSRPDWAVIRQRDVRRALTLIAVKRTLPLR